jgi:gliding motility-associated-like protein
MKFLLSLFFFLFFFQASGAHLVGGEISYVHLGNNKYQIVFTLYRDQFSGGAQLPNSIEYTIYESDNSQYFERTTYQRTVNTLMNPNTNPCLDPPANIGVQRGIYIDTVTLPVNSIGYYVTYQRCCWAAGILNMVNSDDYGLLLRCDIPGTNLVTVPNNSAAFTNLPPFILCTANQTVFDHSAIDPDGDSLVYSLCDPDKFLPSPVNDIDPSPELPGPYVPILWTAGYADSIPFGPASPITLDSVTGLLTFTPMMIGNFMTGVCIEEYRNGVLINYTNRTYNFGVVNCDVYIPFEVETKNETGAANGGTVNGVSTIVEDCGEQFIYFSRTAADSLLFIDIQVSGTATNGVDYPTIPNTFTMLPGVFNDTISFTPFFDSIDEDTETVKVKFIYYNICDGTYDADSVEFQIVDYRPLSISNPIDSVNVCPDSPENAELSTIVKNGTEPYGYYWHSDPNEYYPDQANITVGPDYITEFLNPYSVEVTDACGKKIFSDTIYVYNQCPIIVPNVVTSNGDGINEVFIIRNIQDYEAVHLRIFNRWGEMKYESADYKNDWTVVHKNGAPLVDGVYFYTAEVINDKKYVYDDQEKTQYQAQGFFQVVGE